MNNKASTRIIFLISFVLIILCLLYGYTIKEAKSFVQNQVYQSIETSTENLVSQLDLTLSKLYEDNCSLVSQTNIRKLGKISALMTEYEKIETIKELREEISSISNSNIYVKYVRIYFNDIKKVINSTSYTSGSFSYLTKEQYDFIAKKASFGSVIYYTNPLDGQDTLSILISSSDCVDDFVIEIVLSLDAIESYLNQNLSFNEDYYRALFFDSIELSNIENELNLEDYYIVEKDVISLNGHYTRFVSNDAFVESFKNITRMSVLFVFVCIISVPLFIYAIYQFLRHDYEQKILLQKSELKQLQAQINPHFLYNSFFLLQTMIKTGQQEESTKMASLLGQYFRYITKSSMDQVPLKEEYQHASLYAKIQSMRFEGRISVEILDLPLEFENLPVPKLILQPLLENAFNHGMKEKLQGGIIKMYCITSDNHLKIIVEDNSDNLSDEKLNELMNKINNADTNTGTLEMTGLLNIRRRLSIFSNQNCILTVEQSSLGGLKITIPLV